MTKLLERAFNQASRLPEELQDQLAARLLQELADEEKWEAALADPAEELEKLADKALREHGREETNELGSSTARTISGSPPDFT